MEKLKTLRDLQDKTSPCMKCGSIQCAVCYDDLKQEAIEWIKEIQSKQDLSKNCGYEIWTPDIKEHPRALYDVTAVNWIKMFFNITEEDLK